MSKMKKPSRKAARIVRPKTEALEDCVVRDPADRRRALRVRVRPGASAKDRAETQRFVDTLEANQQIARGEGPMPAGATHRVEPDAAGHQRLVRKRFSAI
jgi:hypothetical protein